MRQPAAREAGTWAEAKEYSVRIAVTQGDLCRALWRRRRSSADRLVELTGPFRVNPQSAGTQMERDSDDLHGTANFSVQKT
jgi:hypothetical protein